MAPVVMRMSGAEAVAWTPFANALKFMQTPNTEKNADDNPGGGRGVQVEDVEEPRAKDRDDPSKPNHPAVAAEARDENIGDGAHRNNGEGLWELCGSVRAVLNRD